MYSSLSIACLNNDEKEFNELLKMYSSLSIACLNNDEKEFNELLKTAPLENINCGLAGAVTSGSFYFVNKLIEHGANDFELGLRFSCTSGNMELAKLFINLGANNFECGLCKASEEGHMELVLFMISKGAIDFNDALYHAASKAQWNIVKFFCEEKHVDPAHGLFALVEETNDNHLDMLEYFIQQGVTNVVINDAFCFACKRGLETYIKFLISSGATDFNDAFLCSCDYACFSSIYLMVEYGATSFSEGLCGMVDEVCNHYPNYPRDEYHRALKFLIDKGARAWNFIEQNRQINDFAESIQIIHYYIKHTNPPQNEVDHLNLDEIRDLYNVEGFVFPSRFTFELVEKRKERCSAVKEFFKTYENNMFDINICSIINIYIEY